MHMRSVKSVEDDPVDKVETFHSGKCFRTWSNKYAVKIIASAAEYVRFTPGNCVSATTLTNMPRAVNCLLNAAACDIDSFEYMDAKIPKFSPRIVGKGLLKMER